MAAPLGFKTFTTGEVLTAADTNGYLMQGIWTFANATARDAAVTSPQEGNTCYLKDTDVIQVYSGSAWVTKSGSSGTSWSLLNAGGTALTGAQTITVSGISSQDKIMVLVINAGSASAASIISIRLNTDTGANYATLGMTLAQPTTYAVGSLSPAETLTATNIPIGKMNSSASSKVDGTVLFSGCNSSGVKVYQASGTGDSSGGNAQVAYAIGGYYNSSSTISSVSVFSSVGNFDEGTVYVYASA